MANTNCSRYNIALTCERLKKDNYDLFRNKIDIQNSIAMTEEEKRLFSWYPMVYHPLPRDWSNEKNGKCISLGLSHNELRVFYKGTFLILINLFFYSLLQFF